jgi:hypothetical protein
VVPVIWSYLVRDKKAAVPAPAMSQPTEPPAFPAGAAAE